ncbi:MAG: hypothetical protein IT427_04565 [Pirellulales bacterium]|nr:hypothetical protein [Pirellulales bacterium]
MLRSRFPAVFTLTLFALLIQGVGFVRAEDPPEKAKAKADSKRYLRISRDEKKQPLALETSVVRFVPRGNDRPGLQVDLVSAVHVGEKAYYDALNKRFDEYDVVLFELVAPTGTKIPKGGGQRRSLVSTIQTGMKDMLDLEFQLECIDYTKKHFVHADLTPDEFAKSMENKGESFWTIFMRLMTASMAQQASNPGQSTDLDLLMALFDRDRSLKLKRVMADQFTNMDIMMNALNGPDGSTLITERNKAALAVLEKEIEAGRKKIAIFYGGGHMADMQSRLIKEFDLKPTSEQWFEAWNLRAKK